MPPTRRISLPVVDSDVEDAWRPKTRGDCARVGDPCPYVGCRYHLLLQVNQRVGSIGLNRPRPAGKATTSRKRKFVGMDDQAVEWLQGMRESCTLDVAERGSATLEEIAELIGVTRERVRQIEAVALRKLAALLEEERIEIMEALGRLVLEGHPLEQAQDTDPPGGANALLPRIRRFERTDERYRKSAAGKFVAQLQKSGKRGSKQSQQTQAANRRRRT